MRRSETPMKHTLGQAAKATGKSKATIHRDVKSGKLSAERMDDGSYRIDAAELFRVYPPAGDGGVTETSHETPHETIRNPNETGVLQAEIDGLRQQISLLTDERDDLRRRLDAESEERRKLTALLTDQRPSPTASQPSSRGLWSRLFGK